MHWYYAKKDKTHAGPVDKATLASLFRSGDITPETLVWKEGMSDWAPYAGVFPPPPLETQPVAGPTPDAGELWKDIESRGYDFTMASVLTQSWNLVKANFWPCVGVTLFCYLIMIGSQQIPFIGFVAIFLVQPQILAGLGWYFLRQFRGQPATLNDAFEGFRRGYGQQALYMLILMGIIVGIITLFGILAALLLPAITGVLPEERRGLGAALLVSVILIPFVLAIWHLTVRFLFTSLLILDKGLKATAAMKLSHRVAKIRFWKITGLFLVLGLLFLVSALALCVGVVVLLPIAVASISRLYEDIFGEQKGPVRSWKP